MKKVITSTVKLSDRNVVNFINKLRKQSRGFEAGEHPAEPVRRDIGKLRKALYGVVEENAARLSGPEVVRALKKISEDMFEAGVDEACRKAEATISDWHNIADAWDLTYLTVFAIELKRLSRRL